jgi:hypothetical protein
MPCIQQYTRSYKYTTQSMRRVILLLELELELEGELREL